MVVEFAIVWHLKEITGSATILTTAMMVGILPIVFLSPFVGPFIDRWDRKKIMILADLSTMLLTVLLVVLFFTDTAQIWHIYVVLFGRSIGQVFQQPAFRATVPTIVPEKHLVRANGLTTILQGATILIGPPAGAFLMKTLPMQWVLSVDIITAVVAIGCLLPIGLPKPLKSTVTKKINVLKDMTSGFRYLASWKPLLLLLIMCSLMNLFSYPLQTLLALFVEKYLANDVLKLGWLQMGFGIGIFAGGLLLSAWSGFKKRIMTSFTGFIMSIITFLIFGFTNERLFIMGLIMYMITGVGVALSNAPIEAIIQANVPQDMQGRVFSVLASICTAAIPVGLIISGPIADAVELRWLYIISSGILLILTLSFFIFGKIFSIEDQRSDETLQ